MSDEAEPVSLRQIFVPLRVSDEDLAESAMAGPEDVLEKETEAALPGVDAFKLLEEHPFICLAGLPGSGKTTLVKAIIGELCGGQPSPLRRSLAGDKGIAPVPIILRELSGFERMQSFDDLMDAWWENLAQKARQSSKLDIERLRHCFAPAEAGGDGFPLLLLFDGIDETGGADVRSQLAHFASIAWMYYGYRVLITGRPNGFDGISKGKSHRLKVDKENQNGELRFRIGMPFKLLPLSWPQIRNFIHRWYGLRLEWKIKRDLGTSHFLEALRDPARAYLLTLARRPIFLTLMALVHCTDNEMPHGRAELYRRIVDLYLNRQERHRQIKFSTRGKPLKPWPAEDKRRVLSHIAYQSQLIGSEAEKARENPDSRRILWPRADLVALIREYLQGRSGFGIAPDEAEDLLDYFLHPAGLLIEPREGEISFAHLSFQEYLCAEDIQRRLSGRKFEQTFRDELMARLDKPGWDEVGLLLLVIHKNQSDDGHLELLELLYEDRKNAPSARLFVTAWCGRELGFSDEQRGSKLPEMAECCVAHPDWRLPGLFREWAAAWESRGLDWVISRLRRPPNEAELHGLLALVHESRWACREDAWNPIASPALAQAVCESLGDETLLWSRRDYADAPGGLPFPTEAGYTLEALLPATGLAFRRGLALMPVDAWLLQGESYEEDWLYDLISQPGIWLTLYPQDAPPSRSRLALGLYGALLLAEQAGRGLFGLWEHRSQLQLQLQSRSRSLSRSLSLSLQLSHLLVECSQRLNFAVPEPTLERFARSLERLGYQYAAHDFFLEQAEDPGLVYRRGLCPGEPLPQSLNLFDKRGLPLERQTRENWLKLRQWLDDDDAVLAFFFPEGLVPDDEAVLRKDLAILKQQPWSPQAFIQATLNAWPEDGSDLDCSYTPMEQDMFNACERFLKESNGLENPDSGHSPE